MEICSKFPRITMFQFKTYNSKSHMFKNAKRDIPASGAGLASSRLVCRLGCWDGRDDILSSKVVLKISSVVRPMSSRRIETAF